MAGFLILAGVTGALIAFHNEIDAWISPALFRVEEQGAQQLSLDAIVAAVERAHPTARVSYVPLHRKPGHSLVVGVVPGAAEPLLFDQVFVDPATGRILGKRLWGAARLQPAYVMPFLYKLHYSLHIPGVAGLWLMGLIGLAWATDGVAGWWLSFPKGVRLLDALIVRWRSGGYKRTFDLHRATGVWLWPVFITLALTGAALNLHAEMFRPLMSLASPVTPFFTDSRPQLASPLVEPSVSWDAALERAVMEAPRHFAGLQRSESIDYWPEHGLYRVGFFSSSDIDQRYGRSRLWIDAVSGKVVHVEFPTGETAGDAISAWLYPLHSGTFAGLAGRIAVAIAGLAAAFLAATGVLVWASKRRALARRCSVRG